MRIGVWMAVLLMGTLGASGAVPGAWAQGGPGVERYALLELGPTGEELIGVQITADAIREALGKIPPRLGPDVVILRFRCDGGMLREVPKLVDLITDEEQRGVRVVGWVDSAVSAAALTALACPEIVMRRDGTIGAAVTYEMKGGEPVALRGEELDKALRVGAEIAKRTGRDPRIIRAMQTPTALSYDVGPNGAVTLVDGTGGHVLLSSEGSILTLAAPQAKEIGLSLGTADDLDGVMGLLGVRTAQDVGLVASGALAQEMRNASAALKRMKDGVTDLWEALDHAREAENSRTREFEAQRAGETLAALKADAKDWPNVAAYLRLDESALGAYGAELAEIRSSGK